MIPEKLCLRKSQVGWAPPTKMLVLSQISSEHGVTRKTRHTLRLCSEGFPFLTEDTGVG